MELDFTNLSYDGKWYKLGDCELKIRFFPSSLTNVIMRDGNQIISGPDQREAFVYCLQDWRNVVDANGKALPCTDKIKEKVFDFRLAGIKDFVLIQSMDAQAEKEKQEKN